MMCTSIFRSLLGLWALLLLALVVGCMGDQTRTEQNAQATIAVLATENARLAAAVATLAHTPLSSPATEGIPVATPVSPLTAAVSVPAPVAPISVTAVVTTVGQAAPAAQPGASRLPRLLVDLPLSTDNGALLDFRLDRASNRIYVTDTQGKLYVLDASSYALLHKVAANGELTLDSAQQRLYVAPGAWFGAEGRPPTITVFDTTTFSAVGALPGRYIAVDSSHNRLFVGDGFASDTASDAPGIRIYDGGTLQQTGEIAQAGIPVYNPRRNDLLIVAYTVYQADPDAQRVVGDLLPEVSEVPLKWCNGCSWADGVYVWKAENLLALLVNPHCTGGGCGINPPPKFYDATTLEPHNGPIAISDLLRHCGSQPLPAYATEGRAYRNERSSRYAVFNNLSVYDDAGNLFAWRDGQYAAFINPHTQQAYTHNGYVLDLATLTPAGAWPAMCIFGYDPTAGVLFGQILSGGSAAQGTLRVVAETGGTPSFALTASTPITRLLDSPYLNLKTIAPSPAYAQDGTVLVVRSDGAFFRSVDGGRQWQWVQVGFPQTGPVDLAVAFSPNYATDQTIFVGGARREAAGEGVWRSTDGGQTWQPHWQGLTHLRIRALAVSPNFATDNTVLAQAQYYQLARGEQGVSWHQSTDGGLGWSLLITAASESLLPTAASLLPGLPAAPTPLVRMGAVAQTVEYSLDAGVTWQRALLLGAENEFVEAIALSPNFATDKTLYILSDAHLWRSSDGGETWSVWADAAVGLRLLAVSPPLTDGGYHLFVTTASGDFLTLSPAMLAWEPAPRAAVAAVATQPMTPTASLSTTLESTLVVTKTPTPSITAAPTFTVTPPPPLAGEPPPGLHRPTGVFAADWEKNPSLQNVLGWAREAANQSAAAAIQQFEGGVMIWRQDTSKIYVLYTQERTWQAFTDTFQEGQLESDPGLTPPAGRFQPIRGFGKVWREQPQVRAKLGWAWGEEAGFDAPVQAFEHGFMLWSSGVVYSLVEYEADVGILY